MTVLSTSISCSKTVPAIKEQKVFWGNKEEVKLFLDSDKAKAERWLTVAVEE